MSQQTRVMVPTMLRSQLSICRLCEQINLYLEWEVPPKEIGGSHPCARPGLKDMLMTGSRVSLTGPQTGVGSLRFGG